MVEKFYEEDLIFKRLTFEEVIISLVEISVFESFVD